jgi:hypothetical protein
MGGSAPRANWPLAERELRPRRRRTGRSLEERQRRPDVGLSRSPRREQSGPADCYPPRRPEPGEHPPLTEAQILKWAARTQKQTGSWPKVHSEAISGAPGETWSAVDDALRHGLRGLPGGSSLALLLVQRRGVRSKMHLPRLTLRDIRRWARAHRQRSGKWPTVDSGPIPEAPGENWRAINLALYNGHRGLPGDSSLAKLLKQGRRGIRAVRC